MCPLNLLIIIKHIKRWCKEVQDPRRNKGLGTQLSMKEMNVVEVAKAVGGKIINGDTSLNITSVSTDSRGVSQGGLFVPIIGENHDAHDFVESAYKNGAIACFTSKDDIYKEDLVCIKVRDTLEALQDLAAYYRSQFNIPIIGITGSAGKTSTKEMVSEALSTKYKVLRTAGNMNSQIGLPLMMLRIEEDHDLAVIEMGISEEGEMERLVRIAKPDVAIVTNIGVSHIELLKTKENIRKEKLKIINEFNDDSVLFVNGNDDLLWEIVELKNKESSQRFDKINLSDITLSKLRKTKVVSFGTHEKNAYSADNVKIENTNTSFTLVRSDNTSREDIELSVLGNHNINNSLCALSLAHLYNIPSSTAKLGLKQYKPIAMRGVIKEAKGITIIDDTYNASPDSMKTAIEVLVSLKGMTRRIAVLADVLELGHISQQAHFEVGQYISNKNIDTLITIGKEAKHIADGLNSRNKNIRSHSFDNNNEAIKYLEETLKEGDALLVKGSRGMKTEEIVDFFLRDGK